jgi:hypothetical protein
VQPLAAGAAAVGLAAGALALDERTWKHFAKGAETADEATAQLQLRITRHKGLLVTDSNDTVRNDPCQDPLKICKNDPQGESKGKLSEIKRLALPRPYGLRNRWLLDGWNCRLPIFETRNSKLARDGAATP